MVKKYIVENPFVCTFYMNNTIYFDKRTKDFLQVISAGHFALHNRPKQREYVSAGGFQEDMAPHLAEVVILQQAALAEAHLLLVSVHLGSAVPPLLAAPRKKQQNIKKEKIKR